MAPAVDMTTADFFTKASAAPASLILVALGLGWYLWSVRRLRMTGRGVAPAPTALVLPGGPGAARSDGLGAVRFRQDELHDQQPSSTSWSAWWLRPSSPFPPRSPWPCARPADPPRPPSSTPCTAASAGPCPTRSSPGRSTGCRCSFCTSPTSTATAFTTSCCTTSSCCTCWSSVACLVWPAADMDPLPRRLNYGQRIIYMLLFLPFHTVLGMAIESQSSAIAPGMTITDFHTGGGLLWVSGEISRAPRHDRCVRAVAQADERSAKRYERTNERAAAQQTAHWRATREAAARAASD